jgi:hypothetical protein
MDAHEMGKSVVGTSPLSLVFSPIEASSTINHGGESAQLQLEN